MLVGRPKKEPKESLVEVPCKVPYEVAGRIAEVSISTDRSRSQIARKFVLRGLVAYERDGLLDEPAAEASTTPTRTSSTTPLKPKRRNAIEDALDAAMGLNGKPLSKKDRDTLRKKLEEEESSED